MSNEPINTHTKKNILHDINSLLGILFEEVAWKTTCNIGY